MLLGALFAFLHVAVLLFTDSSWAFYVISLFLTSLFSMLTFAVWAGGVSGDIPGHYGPSFALFVTTFAFMLIWTFFMFVEATLGGAESDY